MNINENQRYYKLIFPRRPNNQRISLLEKKKLESDKYHLRNHGDFVPIIIFKKKTAFIQESPIIPRQEYTIYEKENTNESFRATNCYWLDDIFYDAFQEIVLYGNTSIYLIKKGGRLFDVVTGIEVPARSFFTVRELVGKSDFNKFQEDLKLIEQHKELYQDTIVSIFGKYEQEYLNYCSAQEKYRKKLDAFLENPGLFQEEDLSLQSEKGKVKSKIYEIDW